MTKITRRTRGHNHTRWAAILVVALAASLLARSLKARQFVMLTDVDYVYLDFGTPEQRAIRAAHPDALEQLPFDAGSMGPKIRGACRFVRETGRRSAIGSLGELNDIVAGRAGTQISMDAKGIEFFKPGE